MRLGIVGLPFSGKTTVFNALTGAQGATGGYSKEANTAVVNVPDQRVDTLCEMFPPKSIHYAQIEYVDIPGVSASDRHDQIVGTLAAIREVDALVQVVRDFEAPAAPHPHGSLDPKRDARELWEELLVADMDVAERRAERLRKQIHKPTPTQEQDKRQLAVLDRCLEAFEQGKGVREIGLSDDDSFAIRAFQFLTEKPMLFVLNVEEDQLGTKEAERAANELNPDTVVMSARIEAEIGELDPEERTMFMEELGIEDLASGRLVRACYRLLNLRSFFTGIALDFHVWTVRGGETAFEAAGEIHSDIQRGFIRAEVISYDDVVELGSEKAVRAAGRARLEGKDYEVKDGDIILFRFKV